jgi:hypothetical protein
MKNSPTAQLLKSFRKTAHMGTPFSGFSTRPSGSPDGKCPEMSMYLVDDHQRI